MKISYYETCNSQYHSGHHLPTVQIMIDENTTLADIYDGLLDTQNTEHLDYQFEQENLSWDDYNNAVDEFKKELLEYAKGKKLTEVKWDNSLEIIGEDEDYDCYSYFIIDPEVNEK